MEVKNQYRIIRCGGCTSYPCKVNCKYNALASSAGDLIIEAIKCSECPQAKRNGIPLCIENCKYSSDKNVISIVDIDKKRENAVYALSLM
ncbi:MAG: hypothetical protein Ta2G_14840 [Termitinemataceae bacterium]|nr:MAG: hypothetical protein Ta2G_14840 [Termitinemataceae bacterium]